MKTVHRSGRATHHDGRGLERIVTGVKDRFSDLAHEAMAVEGELYDEAKKRGGELLVSARHQGERTVRGTERWIKQNPGPAVGLAFLLGVAMKAWFGRDKT